MKRGIIRTVRSTAMRTLPLMLTCEDLDRFIVDYLDGKLPARQHGIVQMHLVLCPDCRAYLRAYREAMVLGDAALRDPELESLPEDLVRAIVAARSSEEK